jgi:AbrB family looped-hinge helix DNA binding protein
MKAFEKGQIFGTVTVGERGQIVIPAEIRKQFKIKSSDKLILLSKGDMISFVRADDFNNFVNEAAAVMAKVKNKNYNHD